MNNYELETLIREIVLQLSQPAMDKCNQCFSTLTSLEQTVDDLNTKFQKHLYNFSQTENRMLIKFHELDLLSQKFVKYETDYLAKEMNQVNELGQTKIDIESLKFQISNSADQQRNMSYQYLKLNEDIQQTAKKSMEQMNELQEKIGEYIKDQFTQFIDLRNRFNDINEKFQYVEKDIKNQSELSTYFKSEFESYKQLKDNMRIRIENINAELEQKIQKQQFQESIELLEYNRLQGQEQQRHFLNEQNRFFEKQMNEVLDKVDDAVTNSNLLKKHFKEIEQQLTLHQSENRDRMSNFTKTVLELQILLKETQESSKTSVKEINDNYQILINTHQTNTRNQILRLSKEQDSFKDKITKVFTEELQKEKNKVMKSLESEIETISQKVFSQQIEQKMSSIKKNSLSKEVQVDILQEQPKQLSGIGDSRDQLNEISIPNLTQFNSAQKRRNTANVNVYQHAPQINYHVVQDMIEKTLFDLINETLASSQVLKDQINSQLEGQKKEVQRQVEELVQSSLKVQSSFVQRKQHEISRSDVLDPIDELKAEIQILNEMRNEMEQRFQQLSIEFKQTNYKVEKQNTQLLKLKSDSVNDIEYINGQLRVLIRDKESNQTKHHQVVNCLSCTSETLYVILAVLLQLNDTKYHKVQSISDGVVCEINHANEQNKIVFRNARFDIAELLSKQFQNQMETWVDNDLSKSYRLKDNYVQTLKNSMPVTTTELSRTFGDFQKSVYEPTLSGRNSKQSSRKSAFRARSSKLTVHKHLKQQGLSDSFSR